MKIPYRNKKQLYNICFLSIHFIQKCSVFKVKCFEIYGTWIFKIGQLSSGKFILELRPTFRNYSQFINWLAEKIEL